MDFLPVPKLIRQDALRLEYSHSVLKSCNCVVKNKMIFQCKSPEFSGNILLIETRVDVDQWENEHMRRIIHCCICEALIAKWEEFRN